MYTKIVVGFVAQQFEDDGTPISQEFITGDDVSYEDEFGDKLDREVVFTYLPYEMEQPPEPEKNDV